MSTSYVIFDFLHSSNNFSHVNVNTSSSHVVPNQPSQAAIFLLMIHHEYSRELYDGTAVKFRAYMPA